MFEKPGHFAIVVLNDFETYTDRSNCTIRYVPDRLREDPFEIELAIRNSRLEWEPVITTNDVITLADQILDEHPEFFEAYRLLTETLWEKAQEVMQRPSGPPTRLRAQSAEIARTLKADRRS